MEWYKEDVVNFIGELRKRDLLWNTKNKHYKDPTKRRAALNELSAMFGCDTHEVKSKISNLRRQFNREHIKVTRGHESVTDQGPRWFAYKPLLFLVTASDEGGEGLRNEDGQQDSEGGDEVPMKTEVVESDGEVITVPECPVEVQLQLYGQPSTNPGGRPSPAPAPSSRSVPNAPNLRRKGMKRRRDTDGDIFRDEHSVYGEHVANQLRSLGDRVTAATVRLKIDEVLFKASMGVFSRVDQSRTSSHSDGGSPSYDTEVALCLVEPKLEPLD